MSRAQAGPKLWKPKGGKLVVSSKRGIDFVATKEMEMVDRKKVGSMMTQMREIDDGGVGLVRKQENRLCWWLLYSPLKLCWLCMVDMDQVC